MEKPCITGLEKCMRNQSILSPPRAKGKEESEVGEIVKTPPPPKHQTATGRRHLLLSRRGGRSVFYKKQRVKVQTQSSGFSNPFHWKRTSGQSSLFTLYLPQIFRKYLLWSHPPQSHTASREEKRRDYERWKLDDQSARYAILMNTEVIQYIFR